MTLSDLASIGGFISGVAVVITLVFLLIQMRETNLNQRALMQQMRSARSIDTILRHAEPGLNETISLAMQGEAAPSTAA
jgi:heme exporter protein D